MFAPRPLIFLIRTGKAASSRPVWNEIGRGKGGLNKIKLLGRKAGVASKRTGTRGRRRRGITSAAGSSTDQREELTTRRSEQKKEVRNKM